MSRNSVRLTLLVIAFLVAAASSAGAQANLVESILGDPAAPVAGDPHGDVTIVAFLDYNCPYCRRATPMLDRFVASDRHVKLIYKDWPILAPSSIVAAKVALAANYQGKYQIAHDALMAIKLSPATQASIKQAMETAGIDLTQLNKDLAAHNAEISALLQRNIEQANALHLQGTPVYLIGPYLIAGAIDEAGLKKLVTKLRDAK
ncbi:disulfide bond formation protein DsbA [Methylovirgula ligni]|uniref:Protein-disulfide isomerase n=1 Tax=Methylovirgula ligni TaxID=569860 RepID=A0A3D9Z434_9HYPH|nr:DsbA family protein [Methylovirgula ligni]QAY95595.1 disulfide bond formation protein DsbA [Methylovirgula ligni]REF89058.1 protein-disulfide isomerase [Methylovirgula ligni]